ncbi:isopentenyl-diphosphate Delta-isomerase [uncultured Roseovarius sp.]|uniref:isopentenyl-diphosphate Delta-isomerase n=1 Tax=uncultured Roseovarius sp. TaxID=293344 RepID=UPI0025CDC7FF|nr:isopentenyl-diphosphate Delta-isomerase [uncultured Roseovarius sp.]
MTDIAPTEYRQNTDMIPTWVGGDLVAVEKLRVHREGLRHKAVSVFVICGDDMLIQRRAMGKYHTPGLWANACCTHPHWGEAPKVCAARRLAEEIGLQGLPLSYRQQVEYRADVGDGLIEHEVVDIFVARVRARIPVAPNPDEVMQVQWISMADLARLIAQKPKNYTPWLRIYLEDHAQQIFA